MLRLSFLASIVGVLLTVVYGEDELPNLAFGKPVEAADQSVDYPKARANDEDGATIYHSNSASGFDDSGNKQNPWWRVDLMSIVNITEVKVVNRRDCCQGRILGVKVEILDVDGGLVDIRNIEHINYSDGIIPFNFNGSKGRYIQLTQDIEGQFLAFADIIVHGTTLIDGLEDAALNRPAISSGVYGGNIESHAVDGVYGTLYHSNTPSAWWQVDLQSVNEIAQVTIHNRDNCCQFRLNGAIVEILDERSNVVASEIVSITMKGNVNVAVIPFPADTLGKYVRIKGEDYLHFIQVDVYGSQFVVGMGNLALNRPVTYSTQKSDSPAIGVVDGIFDLSGMYESTTTQYNYVRIQLDTTSVINQINVFNRIDCCSERINNAYVEVMDFDGRVVAWKEGDSVVNRFTITADNNQAMIPIDLPNVVGQFVRISLDHGTLHVREVEVFGHQSTTDMPNLALDKKTFQSWTEDEELWYKHVSLYGNDNKLDSYTHSKMQPNGNWYFIDLGAEVRVRQVKIYGRLDCCRELLDGLKVQLISGITRETTGVHIIKLTENSGIEFDLNFEGSLTQFVKIISPHEDMQLSQVKVFGHWKTDLLPNLALHKPTGQSTTIPGDYGSGNAVDGDINTFAHTTNYNNTWHVDLGELHDIIHVTIINRQDNDTRDRLLGAKVQILTEDGVTVIEERVINELSSLGVELSYPHTLRGRYVKITLDGNIFNVAEVEVYGYIPGDAPSSLVLSS
mmetsp:Transcript_26815/g.29669  ORF Transcript_26815/g.29669 Transcript_26815/m.29669 type:complete len:736 (-) Transcript_26815:139-2346(-)